jgi:hypothetical protein
VLEQPASTAAPAMISAGPSERRHPARESSMFDLCRIARKTLDKLATIFGAAASNSTPVPSLCD